MQIQGGQIRLPDNSHLPIPWWYRAPLGLATGTSVFIALVRSTHNPVGDLIVSVINPKNWGKLVHIECHKKDAPGVLASAFESIPPTVNIVLTEASTTAAATSEGGCTHQIIFICEPSQNCKETPNTSEIRTSLETNGFKVDRCAPFECPPECLWYRSCTVTNGWIFDCDWRSELNERIKSLQLSDNPERLEIDYSTAVISADTHSRTIRYVFPRKGTKTIKIEFADDPGFLRCLTRQLVACNVNVLSAYLTHARARTGRAVVIAVCEPTVKTKSAALEAAIRNSVRSLPIDFQADLLIYDARAAAPRIYVRHPADIVARPPSDLVDLIRAEKGKLNRKKLPVFFSRRFFSNNTRAERIASRIREVLEHNGCEVVEGLPERNGIIPVPSLVASKMWVSKAGIVLVIGAQGSEEQFNENLAHEFGFIQGQGKPLMLLVEGGQAESMRKWTNGKGISAPRFAPDDRAFNPDDPESINKVVQRWLNTLRP
jgi:hypothetical protein